MGSFVEDNFFIIDSRALEKVESHLYGFSMVDDIVVNDSNYHGEELGWGAYVNVIKTDSQVVIKQDNMGSQGLYLFKSGDFFAISNSFLKLMDHLKSEYTLTFNEKYADAFLAGGLCAYSFDETLINEISIIDRNADIYIDIAKCSLDIDVVDKEENAISIGTKEGIAQLDLWYKRWTAIINRLIARGEKTIVDLTGGFDSRMVFTLFLHPEIDLSKVMIKSDNDKRYTHEEDYAIASQMKEKYGFELNKPIENDRNDLYNSLDDAIDIIFYDKLGFHNGMEIREKSPKRGEYHFSGNGGETVRSGDMPSEDIYIAQKSKARSKDFPKNVRPRLSNAISEVMRRSYSLTSEKLRKIGGGGKSLLNGNLTRYMYRETRNRVHFGKSIWDAYLGREYRVSPLLDPDFQKIALSSDGCEDDDLLMAVIFIRYGRGIIEFPVQGGRSIKNETIEFAKRINEKYPFSYSELITNPEKTVEDADFNSDSNNPVLTKKQVEDKIEDIFYSKEIKKFISDLYGKSTYKYICYTINNKKSNRLSHAYASLAIYAAYQAAEKNSDINSKELLESLSSIPEYKRYRPKNNFYRKSMKKIMRKLKNIYGLIRK